MDRYHERKGTAKMLLVYPLCRRVQQRLLAAVPPTWRESPEEMRADTRPASNA
jgi:hypothetical protein